MIKNNDRQTTETKSDRKREFVPLTIFCHLSTYTEFYISILKSKNWIKHLLHRKFKKKNHSSIGRDSKTKLFVCEDGAK